MKYSLTGLLQAYKKRLRKDAKNPFLQELEGDSPFLITHYLDLEFGAWNLVFLY